MIKRRFFKHEHGDKDAPSDSSSSSSSSDDSESEVELQSDNENNDDNVAVAQVKQSNVPCSSSSSGLSVPSLNPLLLYFYPNVFPKLYFVFLPIPLNYIFAGYESEESSAHEVDLDSPGLVVVL